MADSATSRRRPTAGRSGGPGRRAEAAEPTGTARPSRAASSGSGGTRRAPAKTSASGSASAGGTAKPAGKTSAATTAKTAAKSTAKPASKPATKPATTAAKSSSKPAGKPASKPAASKPAAAKPAAAKPAGKPATRPAARTAPNAAGWSAKELAEVQTDLREQYDVLRTQYDQAMAALDDLQRVSSDNAGDDQADTGSKTFEREQEMSIAHNRLDLLSQIERALGRIEDGSYGLCENCGNPIAKPRLQAFPSATLCVECKQKQERR